ncbi:Ig-like domain-containing protein [Paludisphaera sp.]|uniref:Ig-like domain-containing protein n=1 Tax=Paludisphaera sp. TaxID=2017432 RepID=UPI00301D04F2
MLEDRRLLAASISADVAGLLRYDGEAGGAETLVVEQLGAVYRFDSTADIAIGSLPAGVTAEYPNPADQTVVDVVGITGMDLLVNSAGSKYAAPGLDVAVNVYDAVPEASYTLDYGVAASASVTISAGANSPLTGDVQSLRIATTGDVYAYHLANKSAIVFSNAPSLSGYQLTVAYASGTPVAGLNSLTANQGAGPDTAQLTRLVPGATFFLNQLSGHDTARLTLAGTEGATSTWLDGGLGIDSLSIDAGGLDLSASDFSVNPDGSVFIQGAALPGGLISYNDYQSITVDNVGDNRATDLEVEPINAVQGVPLVNEPVGTFRTNSTTARAGDFVATIHWGDGSSSAGTVVQDASFPSLFHVLGSHTYANPSPGLPVTLNVRSLSTTTTTMVGSAPVTFITSNALVNGVGDLATVTATTLPALAPTVYGVPIHGVEGRPLNGVLVGAFTSSATARAADFAATIAWGDGATSAGTIVQDASNPSIYHVYGSHAYYAPGQGLATTITVRGLAATSQESVNGAIVTFFRPAGAPVSQASQAFIDDAPIDVSVSAFNGHENIPIATGGVIVATFTDLGGIDPTLANPAATYTATIYWGDGSSGVGAVAIERLGTSARFVVKAAPHTYATPGSYPVTVVVAQAGDPNLGIGSNTATIADAPLNRTPTQPAIASATEGVRIVDAVIATFVDANPLATTDQYEVTVDWGDGSGLQAARVIQPGGVGTPFQVIASHTYANSIPAGGSPSVYGPGPLPFASPGGDYVLIVSVRDTFGSAVNLYNTLTVFDRALFVNGSLDSASDTGASNSDGITNDVTPTFTGRTSEGNATVFVYASKDGGAPIPIGSTTSDASGAWSFTPSRALVDGGYVFQAQAYDAGGHSVSDLATLNAGLVVIDTVGPKVTDVLFDNVRGRVVVTYADAGGVADAGAGLAMATVRDANNYRFLRQSHPLRRWGVNAITVDPGTATGEQVATLTINDGRGIRGGRYSFRILSVDPSNLTGVRDVAGNALDGEYYGYFPSGNNVNGGDFAAYLDAIHRTILPAQGQVGRATPVSPPGRPATGRFIARGGAPLPSGASAVRMAMARQPFTAARAARLAR